MYGSNTKDVIRDFNMRARELQKLDGGLIEEMAESELLILKTIPDLIAAVDALQDQVRKQTRIIKDLETRIDGLDPAPQYKKDESYKRGEKPQPKKYSFDSCK